MSIENKRDVEDYLATLLDFNNPDHKLFLIDFLNKRSEVNKPNAKLKQNKVTSKNQQTLPSKSASVVEESSGAKKKTKYINLYSAEGQSKDVILLKGKFSLIL